MSAASPVNSPEVDPPLLPPEWLDLGSIVLANPDATDALAHRLAHRLESGDTLLLSGHLGSGKTHLARALITTRLTRSEPVPSPSFTLVQTYQLNDGEIWHSDLYRLGDPGEILELGLGEAMDDAICLIEWPDRFDPDWPRRAAMLHLDITGSEARRATLLAPPGTALGPRLAPALEP